MVMVMVMLVLGLCVSSELSFVVTAPAGFEEKDNMLP